MLTIRESEHGMVYSGTDGWNSDIAAMSDFSDDEDEAQEESRPGHGQEVIGTVQLRRHQIRVINRSIIW